MKKYCPNCKGERAVELREDPQFHNDPYYSKWYVCLTCFDDFDYRPLKLKEATTPKATV